MKQKIKIRLFAGLLLAIGASSAFAQMPGMPYMPYVKPPTIPANITLAQNQKYMVASIYDADYLPYSAPTAAATTTRPVPAGGSSPVTIDVQGSIPTSGITVYIPTIATGSGTIQSYASSPIIVPAAMTEDGISRSLTLSWAKQTYTSSTTTITATLSAVEGTLNALKLDINAGVGNDYLGVLLGSISYPYDNAGDVTTYQVRDIAGIPDRMFGKYDLGNSSTYEHNFLYVPVVGEDGQIWLNNNLGADYSNVSSSSFSPGQQATAYNDYHAYGSLFQWGRPADGHELITWSSSTAGTATYSTTSTLSTTDTPTSALFITTSSGNLDWRSPQNDNLWQGEAGTNNPCPSGFRVATAAELTALFAAAGITNYTTAAASKLRFPVSGYRYYYSGALNGPSYSGTYWSSSVDGISASSRYFNSGTTYTSTNYRALGLAVRCLMNNPQVTGLSCGTATVSPATVYAGVSYVGTVTVPYTGGNGLTYPAGAAVASTGVTGLTATLQAGTLASGAGNLTYTLSGTPSAAGTATFAVSFGGQSCSFSVTVSAYTIPATITLAQAKKYLLASIYDNNYLPYTTPTTAATTAKLDVGSTSAVTIDVQGSIPTTGISVYIPVTATDSGTLPAYSGSVIVPSSLTEDGISRQLTLSWAAQAYTSSTTTIPATLSAVGGTLNAKKLDVNAGVGNDGLGVLLGSFSYPYDNAGDVTTYQVRDIAGIPDRMFGKYDLGNTTTYEHNFIYLPLANEDGQIWLNNNLGADYSNVSSTSFNPVLQATSGADYHAYGSFFQWGRPADGHELISWSSSTAGTATYGTTSTLNSTDTPTSALFITPANDPYDWRSTQNDNLWQGEAGTNNPCPSGFRVPTVGELRTLVAAAGITDYITAAASKMRFSIPGNRDFSSGVLNYAGKYPFYWSSSVEGIYANYCYLVGEMILYYYRAFGFPVRCLMNDPQVAGFSCGTATVSPATGYAGLSYTGTATVPYTGGNGLTYPAGAAVASTGVTGLTATLQAGTLASGAGNLTYILSGTPSGTGTATFAVSFGEHNCSFSVTVSAYTIPATITLAQSRKYMVASIYDNNYLPYTAPTTAATTARLDVGSTSAVTINVQGSIPTTGITVYIPVTATNSGTLPAYSGSVIVPAAMTEDGISRQLTLSWAAQDYTGSTTVIAATLSAVGRTFNAKKLDINTGVGNDCLGVLMGSISYPYDNAGDVTTYQVRDIAGIPDRMFGKYDLGNSSTYEHNFIYVPVVGEDGQIWLNNNLGADYSSVDLAYFSPATQAGAYNDFHAYGSLFQWGRPADGHELINWNSTTPGTPMYSTTSTQSTTDTPTSALFITTASSPRDWRSPINDYLWQGEDGINNPCPSGFRVPTNDELTALVTAASVTNYTTAAASRLSFTAAGNRYFTNGTLNSTGSSGYYWSSSVNGGRSSYRNFHSSSTTTSNLYRAYGYSVRCIGN
jgi:uncharacterized protein (TIGR02145 family)